MKGAPPGSALEALGPRPVEVRVGEPGAAFGVELVEFAARGRGAPPLMRAGRGCLPGQ